MHKAIGSVLLLLAFANPAKAQEVVAMYTHNDTDINFNFTIDDTPYTAVPNGNGYAWHTGNANFKLVFDNGNNYTITYWIPPNAMVTFYERDDGTYDAKW